MPCPWLHRGGDAGDAKHDLFHHRPLGVQAQQPSVGGLAFKSKLCRPDTSRLGKRAEHASTHEDLRDRDGLGEHRVFGLRGVGSASAGLGGMGACRGCGRADGFPFVHSDEVGVGRFSAGGWLLVFPSAPLGSRLRRLCAPRFGIAASPRGAPLWPFRLWPEASPDSLTDPSMGRKLASLKQASLVSSARFAKRSLGPKTELV